jgi:hypothetical protein
MEKFFTFMAFMAGVWLWKQGTARQDVRMFIETRNNQRSRKIILLSTARLGLFFLVNYKYFSKNPLLERVKKKQEYLPVTCRNPAKGTRTIPALRRFIKSRKNTG